MLRWRLPTVQILGGSGKISYRILRASSTTRFPSKLINVSGVDGRTSLNDRPIRHEAVLGSQTSALLPTCRKAAVDFCCNNPSVFGDTNGALCPQNATRCAGQSSPGVTNASSLGVTRLEDEASQNSSQVERPTSALRLKAFISGHDPENRAGIHSGSTIRSLYLSAKARSQLHELTSADMSALISLFGTLSTPLNERWSRRRFLYALPSWFSQCPDPKQFWPYIAQLVGDKEQRFGRLDRSDHFWIMHARLAEACNVKYPSKAWERTLADAKAHYLRIRHTSSDSSIHVPYVQALLAHPTSNRLIEAGKCVASLAQRGLRDSLLDLFWQIVLHPKLPHTVHKDLVNGIMSSLARSGGHPVEGKDLRETAASHTMSEPQTDVLTVGGLAHTLVMVLAGPSTRLRRNFIPSQAVLEWSRETTRTVFRHVGDTPRVAFARLALLAMVHQPFSRDAFDLLLARNGDRILQGPAMEWDFVCVMVLLERLVDGNLGRRFSSTVPATAEIEHLKSILSSLWVRWSTSRPTSTSDPVPLGILSASFLYLAGRVGDRKLVSDCFAWALSALSAHVEHPFHPTALRVLYTEYTLASLEGNSDALWVAQNVRASVADPGNAQLVYDDVVSRAARSEPHTIYRFALAAGRLGFPPSPASIGLLAQNLPLVGAADLALTFVTDPTLQGSVRMKIVQSLLRGLRKPLCPRPAPNVVVRLAKLVIQIARTDANALDMRNDLKHALRSFLVRGFAAQVVQAITGITKSRPEYFTLEFLSGIIQDLVRHRHILLARNLVRRLREYRVCVVVGEENLARSSWDRFSGRRSWLHLRALRKASLHQHVSLLPLESPNVSSTRDPAATLPLVLRVRGSRARLSAMKKAYTGVREELAPHVRVGLANHLIHTALMRHASGRRGALQRALKLMQQLMADDGFVPDRVTINILMKGLLHWTNQVNANTVRMLFDRVVKSGYPTGGLCPDGTGPFGVKTEAQPAMMDLEMVKSPVSFNKHAKPLYKMFIRALEERKDFAGANIVRRISGASQKQYDAELAKREEAREEGRRRKRQREQKDRKRDA